VQSKGEKTSSLLSYELRRVCLSLQGGMRHALSCRNCFHRKQKDPVVITESVQYAIGFLACQAMPAKVPCVALI
jgi:hypothetical protein